MNGKKEFLLYEDDKNKETYDYYINNIINKSEQYNKLIQKQKTLEFIIYDKIYAIINNNLNYSEEEIINIYFSLKKSFFEITYILKIKYNFFQVELSTKEQAYFYYNELLNNMNFEESKEVVQSFYEEYNKECFGEYAKQKVKKQHI